MGLGSGLAAQFGIGDEGTIGTYAAPTRFYDFVSETMKYDRKRVVSKGLRAGRRTRHFWAPTQESVAGDINMEFCAEGTGLLLQHMMGAVSTSGAGDPYTHTFTPGDLSDDALTIQIGKPDTGGTVRAFSYIGCKCTDWTFSANVGEYLMLRTAWYGQTLDTGQSLGSASYDADWNPFVYTHGYITVSGTEVPVSAFTLNGDNGLTVDRHRMRSTNPERPLDSLEGKMRSYTGSFTADFTSLTQFNHYKNNTDNIALVLNFDQSATNRSLVISLRVRFDGDTPLVAGPDTLEQTMNFDAGDVTADSDTITIALENGDSTA